MTNEIYTLKKVIASLKCDAKNAKSLRNFNKISSNILILEEKISDSKKEEKRGELCL